MKKRQLYVYALSYYYLYSIVPRTKTVSKSTIQIITSQRNSHSYTTTDGDKPMRVLK